MASQLHVSGTALIRTGTGAANALEDLGICVDGVSITINSYFDPIYTDHYGSRVPYDMQYFLQDAIIRCQLIYYDKAVLYKWLTGAPGLALTEGVMGSAGNLLLQNTLSARVLVKSTPAGTGLTTVEDNWNFPHCYLEGSAEEKVGVQKTVWNLTFHALLNQVTTGSAGAVLFDHTAT